VRLKADCLGALHHVWALSSYATTPDKHDAKAHLNAVVRALLEAHGVEKAARAFPLDEPAAADSSPHLVVACEVFGDGHVMFRCFAHQLRQLRQRFRVTCVVAREDLQGEKPDWCDTLVVFPTDPLDPAELVRRIASLRPDAIFYPCVGMRLWAVLLSNLRLAPVQIAALGHPATTRSRCIDAMIVGSDLLGDSACFSERVFATESPGSVYDLSHANDVGRVEVRERPDVLRVAACGNLLKFNAEFVLAVRDVVTRVRRPLEVHFFPNATAVRHRVVREQLEGLIPAARVIVHTRKPNIEYLHTLKSCDAYLSPFPFGGENSTLDALLCGLPVLTLRGPEPHSRLDARVLRLAGAPEWLITDSRQDYVEQAARLLSDDEYRVEAARAIMGADLPARVDAERRRYERDFVDAVWSAYAAGGRTAER
jgi:hypothetical protein